MNMEIKLNQKVKLFKILEETMMCFLSVLIDKKTSIYLEQSFISRLPLLIYLMHLCRKKVLIPLLTPVLKIVLTSNF